MQNKGSHLEEKIHTVFKAMNQRPIAYQRIYAQLTGSVTGGLLLSQVVYWWFAIGERAFYKTDEEFRDELGMNIREFRTAKAKVRALKGMKIDRRGVPAKTYYIVDVSALLAQISSLYDSRELDCAKRANRIARNARTIIRAENTSENTQRKDKESPEDVALAAYDDTKTLNTGLSPDFLDWFEKQVRSRWDKYKVNRTILEDWFNQLWSKYKSEILTRVVSEHRAECDSWTPKFAEIAKAARKLRTQALAKLRGEEKRREQKASVANIGELRQGFFESLSEQEAIEKSRNGTRFEKQQIRMKRPEVAALAAQQA